MGKKELNLEKRIYNILFIFVISLLFSTQVVDALSPVDNASFDSLEEALISKFGDNYDEFLDDNQYELDVAQKIDDLIKDNYGDICPAYFGGMYISDNSKNLIIQIVEDNIPKSNTKEFELYKRIISMDSTLIIEYVNYSFVDLMLAQKSISNKTYNNKDKNFSSAYIDVINNKVVVELIDDNLINRKLFENKILKNNLQLSLNNASNADAIDSDMVTIKRGYVNKTYALNELYPGQKIITNDGSICSMGFRTKYNGKNGYVTAGHCVYLGVEFNDNRVMPTGQVKIYSFKNNGNADYAFIETSSYTPSNRLAYGKNNMNLYQMDLIVSSSSPTIVVGTAIAKVGQTTKYTAGKITNLSFTATYNLGITINNLIKADLKADSGDSGGAVFIPKTNNTALPIGIISGGPKNDNSQSYFTSINSLPSSLRLGRY